MGCRVRDDRKDKLNIRIILKTILFVFTINAFLEYFVSCFTSFCQNIVDVERINVQ